MVSAWWLFVAASGGAMAGFMLCALCIIAGDDERSKILSDTYRQEVEKADGLK